MAEWGYWVIGIAAFLLLLDIHKRVSIAMDQQQWEAVHTWARAALAVDSEDPMANMMMAVGIMRTNRGEAAALEYEAKARRLDAAGK